MNEDERVKCRECGEFLRNEEFTHIVSYGYWDTSKNKIENGSTDEHYCRECWSEQAPMQRGIKYDVDSSEELIDILESSNGKLVADFNSQIIGSRVFMRIIEGRAEFAYNKSRSVGDNAIGFKSEYEEKDKQDGTEFVEDVLLSGDLPPMIILVKKKNTPFRDYPDIGEDQSKIEEF